MHRRWQGYCFDLREEPEQLDTVLLWLHAEWLKQRKNTIQNPAEAYGLRRIQLQEHLAPSAVPLTLIAKESKSDTQPVLGCVSMARLASASPLASLELNHALWLSNLFVTPTARGLGIGSALLQAVEAQARDLGHMEMYLYTQSSKAYYTSKGWRECLIKPRGGTAVAVTPIAVLKKQLS
ncbi:GNAT family N-acetyltransferase [Marinagarivorans algicola]|uniref:GNAT family N-acetyltransferase n=1 Tax=Marinagarivorans algicola TaxID=1513270 RepID=UPI0006B5015D|nr:GNAT family N-acetyltransferase [Marinagarivorans algicola]